MRSHPAACLLVAAALAAPACGGGPTVPATTRVEAAAAEPMAVVEELASARYAGRRTGSEGGRAARAYLREAFGDIGLEAAGAGGYEQPFTFADVKDAANLVGLVPGTQPQLKAFVITAHYDHLGVRDGATYHGADDNASGIAALLALARAVKAEPLRRTAVFTALDAEELGLQGARALVARPPVPLARVALNINFDMLARNNRNEIYAAGTYHHPWLRPLLEDVQPRAAVRIRFGHDRPGTGPDDWTMLSDHGAFHRAGVPFLYFGVEDHPDYHRPTDTADKIDEAFFKSVVGMIAEAVRRIDREEL